MWSTAQMLPYSVEDKYIYLMSSIYIITRNNNNILQKNIKDVGMA